MASETALGYLPLERDRRGRRVLRARHVQAHHRAGAGRQRRPLVPGLLGLGLRRGRTPRRAGSGRDRWRPRHRTCRGPPPGGGRRGGSWTSTSTPPTSSPASSGRDTLARHRRHRCRGGGGCHRTGGLGLRRPNDPREQRRVWVHEALSRFTDAESPACWRSTSRVSGTASGPRRPTCGPRPRLGGERRRHRGQPPDPGEGPRRPPRRESSRSPAPPPSSSPRGARQQRLARVRRHPHDAGRARRRGPPAPHRGADPARAGRRRRRGGRGGGFPVSTPPSSPGTT